MLKDIANGPAAYIGDLYLSNTALLLVVALVLGLVLILLTGIPRILGK